MAFIILLVKLLSFRDSNPNDGIWSGSQREDRTMNLYGRSTLKAPHGDQWAFSIITSLPQKPSPTSSTHRKESPRGRQNRRHNHPNTQSSEGKLLRSQDQMLKPQRFPLTGNTIPPPYQLEANVGSTPLARSSSRSGDECRLPLPVLPWDFHQKPATERILRSVENPRSQPLILRSEIWCKEPGVSVWDGPEKIFPKRKRNWT